MTLLHGDCLELMKSIPDKSIDLVLTDPPYGSTRTCAWDSPLDFFPIWKELRRIRKDHAVICIFGREPFSTALRLLNIEEFKYDWIWKKSNKGGFVNAKLKPMTEFELISVFSHKNTSNNSKNNMRYFPQGLLPFNKNTRGRRAGKKENTYVVPSMKETHFQEWTNYPSEIIEFKQEKNTVHPTQKPVALLEYLIKTYTLEGETVLDFTMGSGSTGVACKNLNRKFIGIEKDEKYYEIACERIGQS